MKNIVDFTGKIKDKFAMRKDIAPVEESSTASRAYNVGDEFYYGNLLQKATTDIAQGAALVGGTNFENADPVTEQVTSLKETLTNQINVNESKNIFDFRNRQSQVCNIVSNDDGSSIRVYTTAAGTWKYDYWFVGVHPNTDYRVTAQAAYTSGRGVIEIGSKDNTYIASSGAFTSNTDIDFTFNSGNNSVVRITLYIAGSTSVVGDITFNYLMIRLNTISDATWEPCAMTNHQLTTDKVSWDNFSKVGAVNAAPNNGTTQIINAELTFTVNDDKSVTISADSYPHTVATRADFYMFKQQTNIVKSGQYQLRGCPSGGNATDTYRLEFYDHNNANRGACYDEKGDIINVIGSHSNTFQITVYAGCVMTGPLTFKPMLADPEYNGNYEAYAKTNRELTEELTVFDKDTASISGVTIEKVGHTVTLLIRKTMDVPADAMTSLGTIPSRFRPDGNVDILVIEENSNPKYGLLRATSSGNLEINGWTISGTSLQIRGTMTYVVK